MVTRLQVEIERRSSSLRPGLTEGQNFGVWFPGPVMIPLPNDGISFDHNGPHHRIRTRRAQPFAGELQGQPYIPFVFSVMECVGGGD